MMATDYDIAIVGGGLAGLTAAIQLKKKGYSVILFEKKKYPFHRVCGEYISMESWDYLISCGIDLQFFNLPVINKLQVSAPNGNLLSANLDSGGFGISRFLLDKLLFDEARNSGIVVYENTNVEDILCENDYYKILFENKTVKTKFILAAFGKRSNLDVKWKRSFVMHKPGPLNNYIGIKYHVKTTLPSDVISLHNFKNGYCGISKIEDDKYCLCYLTTAANLQYSGSVKALEQNVLYKNKYLKNIFEQSEFLFKEPVAISQISFDKKEVIYNNIPLVGDACGMITPLCGNGMSMAMHAGKLFSNLADDYLQKRISLQDLLKRYETVWQHQFSKRIGAGRFIQSNFGKNWKTNMFIGLMKKMPALTKMVIRSTHGKSF